MCRSTADRGWGRFRTASEDASPQGIHPSPIILDKKPPFGDFLRRHALDKLLKADLRIRVAADRREGVPKIGPHQVRGRQSPSGLIVPTDSRLGAGMALHRGSQVPFESPPVVPLHPKAHRIHDPDEFLGIGIARPGGRFKCSLRLLEVPRLHQVPCLFNFGPGRRGKDDHHCGSCGANRESHVLHPPETATACRPNWRPLCRIAAALAMLLLPAVPASSDDVARPEEAVRVTPDHFVDVNGTAAELGRLLFYDPLISGNRNISCGTCHHHDLASADGVSLGIGQGGVGIGIERTAPDGPGRILRRMPRNSPALFNLGAKEVRLLFHDGRISVDDVFGNGFNTPAEEFLPHGLGSLLAAQSLFPLVGEIEMGGSPEQNEVAAAVNERIDYGWPLIVGRIRGIAGYEPLFVRAFGDVDSMQDISIVHVANALGDFVASEWRSFDSPFDRFLAGETGALSPAQKSGMDLFFGKAGCHACHNGPFLTDQDFHALAIPPLGPGRTRRFDLIARDVGRVGESDRIEDAYRFRTPALRNVALTAPYGHSGAYSDLEGVVRHHLDPLRGLDGWDRNQVLLADVPWLNGTDFPVHDDRLELARLRGRVDIDPVALNDREVDEIVAFLHSLTGGESVKGRLGRPEAVPSGLPVD